MLIVMTAWPGILPLVFPKRYSHFGSDCNRTLHTVISWNAPDIRPRWRDPKETRWKVPKLCLKKKKKRINRGIKGDVFEYAGSAFVCVCECGRVTRSVILCMYSSRIACISQTTAPPAAEERATKLKPYCAAVCWLPFCSDMNWHTHNVGDELFPLAPPDPQSRSQHGTEFWCFPPEPLA